MSAITIPDNWDKVTIEGYISFMKSLGKETETTGDLARLQMSRVCFLTGCEPEDARELTVEEYTKVQRLTKVDLPQRLIFNFKLKGIRYKLIHQATKLTGKRSEAIKTLDAKKLSGGEYASIMNVAKRGQLDNLHQIMFNLCEPLKFGFRSKFPFIGWKAYEFSSAEVEDRINDFKELTMDVTNPASVFFCRVSRDLTKALEDYSYSQLQKMTKQMEELRADLEKDLDG